MANIEKVKQGLKQHHAGICTEKYGTICPYWECEASCSKELMADAMSVIESLQSENKILSENCDGLAKQRDDFAQTIHEQKMEIERLKAGAEKDFISGQNNMLEAQAEGR